ncbi:hypothetical protein ACFWP0_15675 [Achromobacter sp. NPDC058515]|uniref:hypothetical protein n=1 Tax=Achromobacter sp. NPDC058515 TaxID=3346533 RepID=UPI003667B9D9
MMSWLLLGLIALATAGLGAALLRQPGIVLYDWFATRARKPAPAANTPLKNERRRPATQAG